MRWDGERGWSKGRATHVGSSPCNFRLGQLFGLLEMQPRLLGLCLGGRPRNEIIVDAPLLLHHRKGLWIGPLAQCLKNCLEKMSQAKCETSVSAC
eukprot:TsM_000483000 transcript=TsM_000483000 gene=TsM_000483000